MTKQEKLQKILGSVCIEGKTGNAVIDYIIYIKMEHIRKIVDKLLQDHNVPRPPYVNVNKFGQFELGADDLMELMRKIDTAIDLKLFDEEDIDEVFESITD